MSLSVGGAVQHVRSRCPSLALSQRATVKAVTHMQYLESTQNFGGVYVPARGGSK